MWNYLDVIEKISAVTQKIPGVKWWRTSKATRCQTCKEVLFVGRPDPMRKYSAGLGSWYGAPIAVCLGSWRNQFRRRWYHQACCGVDADRRNLAGAWHVFGFAPSQIQQYKDRAAQSPAPLPEKTFAAPAEKISEPLALEKPSASLSPEKTAAPPEKTSPSPSPEETPATFSHVRINPASIRNWQGAPKISLTFRSSPPTPRQVQDRSS
jgi:hypothetical protein